MYPPLLLEGHQTDPRLARKLGNVSGVEHAKIADVGTGQEIAAAMCGVGQRPAKPKVPIRQVVDQVRQKPEVKPSVDASLIESDGASICRCPIVTSPAGCPEIKVATIGQDNEIAIIAGIPPIAVRHSIRHRYKEIAQAQHSLDLDRHFWCR